MKPASAVCYEPLILVLYHRQAEHTLRGDAPPIQKDHHKTFEVPHHEHDFLNAEMEKEVTSWLGRIEGRKSDA